MDPYMNAPHSEPSESTGVAPQSLPITPTPASIELETLNKQVVRIFRKRIAVAAVLSVLWGGLVVFFYGALPASQSTWVIIGVTVGLFVYTSVELLIEIINARKRYEWYQQVNYLVWNIATQIGELAIGGFRVNSRNKMIGSALSFNIRDVIRGHDQMKAADSMFEMVDEGFTDTMVVDAYFTLRAKLDFDANKQLGSR